MLETRNQGGFCHQHTRCSIHFYCKFNYLPKDLGYLKIWICTFPRYREDSGQRLSSRLVVRQWTNQMPRLKRELGEVLMKWIFLETRSTSITQKQKAFKIQDFLTFDTIDEQIFEIQQNFWQNFWRNFRKFKIFDENRKSSTSLRNFYESKWNLISKSHQDNDQQLDENWTAVNSGYQGSSNHHPIFRLEFSQWETTTAVSRFLSAGYFLTVYFCGKMFKNCSFFLDPDLGDDLPQCPACWALGVVILLDNRVRQVSVLLYNLTLSNNSLKWYFVGEKHFSLFLA